MKIPDINTLKTILVEVLGNYDFIYSQILYSYPVYSSN